MDKSMALWRSPLLDKVTPPIQPWWYQLTYPKGLKCPICKSPLKYVLLEEIYNSEHHDGFGNHWRLFEYTCPQHSDYVWLERV